MTVPVWLTRAEIRVLKELVFDAYQADGGGPGLHTLHDKLDLAERSSKTKLPASDPKRQKRKR